VRYKRKSDRVRLIERRELNGCYYCQWVKVNQYVDKTTRNVAAYVASSIDCCTECYLCKLKATGGCDVTRSSTKLGHWNSLTHDDCQRAGPHWPHSVQVSSVRLYYITQRSNDRSCFLPSSVFWVFLSTCVSFSLADASGNFVEDLLQAGPKQQQHCSYSESEM